MSALFLLFSSSFGSHSSHSLPLPPNLKRRERGAFSLFRSGGKEKSDACNGNERRKTRTLFPLLRLPTYRHRGRVDIERKIDTKTER